MLLKFPLVSFVSYFYSWLFCTLIYLFCFSLIVFTFAEGKMAPGVGRSAKQSATASSRRSSTGSWRRTSRAGCPGPWWTPPSLPSWPSNCRPCGTTVGPWPQALLSEALCRKARAAGPVGLRTMKMTRWLTLCWAGEPASEATLRSPCPQAWPRSGPWRGPVGRCLLWPFGIARMRRRTKSCPDNGLTVLGSNI